MYAKQVILAHFNPKASEHLEACCDASIFLYFILNKLMYTVSLYLPTTTFIKKIKQMPLTLK